MSDPKKTDAKPQETPAAAQEGAKEAPKPPLPPETSKALLGALRGSDLKLELGSACLLLSILFVAKGELWAREVKPAKLVEEARVFAQQNPIAWHAMLRGNVMGMARGLELNNVEHASADEYTKLAGQLAAAA